VPYDLMPAESLLRQLCEWEPLRNLVEAILDRGSIYRDADWFGALPLTVMHEVDAPAPTRGSSPCPWCPAPCWYSRAGTRPTG
jgi:hypothetical protein